MFQHALVADGEVVRQHDLQIATDGWLGLVELPEKPYYFKNEDFIRGDTVEIDQELLTSNNFDLLPLAPKVRLFNQRDLGALRNDNFEFHIDLRNKFDSGNNVCHNIEVLIQCKDDIIIIPLMAPSCVGEARLYIPGKEISSISEDMSGFGANLNNWTTLDVICRDRNIEMSVNGVKAISFKLLNEPTGIVGVQVRFNGPGAVRDCWFRGGGEITRL